MNSEILLYFKDISIEIVIISLLIFGLTMLIKWPIKKATANLSENRRKAVNTVIVFIPMLLSLLLNILYFGIFKKIWFGTQVFESVGSCYLFSVLIYAVYSKILLIIKGIKPNKNNDFSKETISIIKSNIKSISSSLKVDEIKLNKLILEIEKLLNIKDEINKGVLKEDIETTETLDSNIESLMSKKLILEDSIARSRMELSVYEDAINN